MTQHHRTKVFAGFKPSISGTNNNSLNIQTTSTMFKFVHIRPCSYSRHWKPVTLDPVATLTNISYKSELHIQVILFFPCDHNKKNTFRR